MAVWALIGFMGCGKSSIGRLVASFCGLGGSPLREFPAAAEAAGRKTAENLPGSLESAAAGRKMAENLPGAMAFIDLDAEIEVREGRSIPEIFAAAGEAGFRAIERDTLEELLTVGGLPPEGRATRGCTPVNFRFPGAPRTEAGGPSASADGGVSEANSRKGKAHLPSDILLSLGGGTLTDEGSRELVKKNCKCIYLRATVETLAANLREAGTEGRPMLAGANLAAPADAPDSLESHIATMMAARGPIYEKAADIILDIDGLSYEQAARQILSIKSSGS